MGCENSNLSKRDSLGDWESESYIHPIPEHRIQLTERQKHLIRETWKIIQADIAQVGVVTFMGLFNQHPEAQYIFLSLKAKSREELGSSAELRQHGLNVMSAVEKVIARLHQPQRVETFLYKLGKGHLRHRMAVEYFDEITEHFINIIKPTLKDAWTIETEEAWTTLFNMITSTMKEALLEEL